jgi:hypothetical protein
MVGLLDLGIAALTMAGILFAVWIAVRLGLEAPDE